MFRFSAILFFFCITIFAQTEPAKPWFDNVRKPTEFTESQLCEITANLRKFLLEKRDIKKLPSIIPNEKSCRVVFITVGGDAWPGRTYYGCGTDFLSAVKEAVEIFQRCETAFAAETKKIAQDRIKEARNNKKPAPAEWVEREKHPNGWNWLRLNVVQYARPIDGFSVNFSRIALTSLVGISFNPALGFAFLPEQLTGRSLMTDSSHLSSPQICNVFTETYNWIALRLWMNLTANNEATYGICQFESDAYYADANGACRMYRGHRMQQNLPTADECIALARQNADAIIGRLDQKSGKFRSPFPEWVQSAEKGEALDVVAELAIALCRLSRETKDEKYAKAAAFAFSSVLKRLKPNPIEKGAAFVSEQEDVPEGMLFSPRKISTIRTNSLACIALLELADCNLKARENTESAVQIARHLKAQIFGDAFYNSVFIETGRPYTESDNLYSSAEDTALALLAMHKAQGKNPELNLQSEIKEIRESIFMSRIKNMPMESIQCSPWIMEALAGSGRTDKEFTLMLVKAGYAASVDMNTAPLYPDYFGSIRNRPSCTMTASRSLFLLELCKWLRDNEKPTWAAEQLENAIQMIWFQRQAMIDRAGASSLPNPGVYVGFFRDNLENYGFNLAGQNAQLLSLTAAARELRQGAFLKPERLAAKIESIIKETDVHPCILNIDVVYSNKDDINDKARELIGNSKIETIQHKPQVKLPEQKQEDKPKKTKKKK